MYWKNNACMQCSTILNFHSENNRGNSEYQLRTSACLPFWQQPCFFHHIFGNKLNESVKCNSERHYTQNSLLINDTTYIIICTTWWYNMIPMILKENPQVAQNTEYVDRWWQESYHGNEQRRVKLRCSVPIWIETGKRFQYEKDTLGDPRSSEILADW